MVKVQECHQHRTCMDCLGARDPYCGWCSLENKYVFIIIIYNLAKILYPLPFITLDVQSGMIVQKQHPIHYIGFHIKVVNVQQFPMLIQLKYNEQQHERYVNQ